MFASCVLLGTGGQGRFLEPLTSGSDPERLLVAKNGPPNVLFGSNGSNLLEKPDIATIRSGSHKSVTYLSITGQYTLSFSARFLWDFLFIISSH